MKLKDSDNVWLKFAESGYMTQREIAKTAGISLQSVNKLFTHNKPVTRKVMFKVAKAINADLFDIAVEA